MEEKNNLFFGLINKDEKAILKIYENTFPNVLKFVVKNSGRSEERRVGKEC